MGKTILLIWGAVAWLMAPCPNQTPVSLPHSAASQITHRAELHTVCRVTHLVFYTQCVKLHTECVKMWENNAHRAELHTVCSKDRLQSEGKYTTKNIEPPTQADTLSFLYCITYPYISNISNISNNTIQMQWSLWNYCICWTNGTWLVNLAKPEK